MATKHDAVTVRSRAKTTPGLSNATGLKKVVKPNRQKKNEKKDKSRRIRNGGARPKNEKKKKLENREKFLKRVDPRNSATTRTASDRQVMSNVSPAHQFEVDLPAKNLAGVMVGVVSFALSRGWQTYSASDSVPFLAYVYGTNVLLQYATNSTPALTTVPRWLNIMGQMLTTKCVFTRTGKITYRFKPDNLTPEVSATWTEPMGPLTYNRLWNIGIAGNTVINMHFRDIVAPVAYTEELGKPAFASLAQFLAEKLDTESSMQEFVAVTLTDYYTGDCSAYAVNVHVPGSGFNGTGGLGTNLQLEIPIRTPIMSVLRAAPSMSGDHTRYPAFVKQSAGDPVYAGGMLCSIMPNSEVSTKKVPLFHCVDFLEFADTLALYCQQLVIQATSTPEFLTSAVANTDAINYACPLTLQEVMLCLRAQMMNAFKETAHAVQGLYPKIPANGDNNEFVAFVSGFGTCPYPGVTNMLLPLSFVENIRSLTARCITGYKNGKKHPLRAIPILGKFYNDVLNPADYDVTYKVNEVEKTVHVFLTPETYVGDVKVSQKGKEKQKIPVAEEIIDLIDGKTGQSFVAINDPGALNPLISLWNSWIQRMSSFSQALAEIGTDAGISLLEMITCTSYFVELTPGEDKVKDPRMTSNNGFTANEYSKRKIIAYSFNQPPYQAPWERIQQRWIAPIIHVDFATTTENSTAFQRMSVLFQEPYQMNVAESSANWTLSNRHLQYAISMTKSQFTRVDEDEKFFADAEKYGRGGILSSLASAFSGPIANISGQLISAGINTAANMIPV